MNKIFNVFSIVLLAFVVFASAVSANEGRVVLSGDNVSCEGISLWKGSTYRVVGRCEGLVYPYATQEDHYVLWAKISGGEEIVRVGEVERGYWDGNVADSFASLYLTAEKDGLPRRASTSQVASGSVAEFGFADSEEVSAPVSTPAPLGKDEVGSMTVQGVDANTDTSTGAVGSVIGKIVKSLLIIVAVVIVLVIGTSLVFRRRGSVST